MTDIEVKRKKFEQIRSDLTAQVAEHLRTGAAIKIPGGEEDLDLEEAQGTLALLGRFLHVLQPGSTLIRSADGTTITLEAEDGTAISLRPDGDSMRILAHGAERDEEMDIEETVLRQLFADQLKPRQG